MASLAEHPEGVEPVEFPPAPDENGSQPPKTMCTLLESDSTWEDPITLVPHGDHFDRISTFNPWEKPGLGEEDEAVWERGWPAIPYKFGEKTEKKSNSSLDEKEDSKLWIKKLSSLSRHEALEMVYHEPVAIPLFDADNGDEYQLHLKFFLDGELRLPACWCPERLENTAYNAHERVFQLTSRSLLNEAPGNQESGVPIPKFVFQLGTLAVRTKTRQTPDEYEYAMDFTEYDVIIDIGHKDMPLWIVGSRPCLSLRATGWFHEPFPASLPIFDGLMANGDGGHDIACILPSIRELASCDHEGRLVRFKEACELVRLTRASIDPISIQIHKEEIEGLFKQEPDDRPIKPVPTSYFSALLVAIGKYFTWDA